MLNARLLTTGHSFKSPGRALHHDPQMHGLNRQRQPGQTVEKSRAVLHSTDIELRLWVGRVGMVQEFMQVRSGSLGYPEIQASGNPLDRERRLLPHAGRKRQHGGVTLRPASQFALTLGLQSAMQGV